MNPKNPTMKWPAMIIAVVLFQFMLSCSSTQKKEDIPVLQTGAQAPMPAAWIDKDTGHRVVRISNRDGDNRSFYFHNNPFVPQQNDEGDLMVFYGSTDNGSQLFTVNLKTKKIVQLTNHTGRIFGEIVDPKNRKVYYQSNDSVFATAIDDQKTEVAYVFPEDFKAGITTLNANGKMLAGVYSGDEKREILKKYPNKGDYFTRIFEAKLPHTLFTVNLETGELKKIHTENTWIGHVQFSPTDPNLLMFCHEGPGIW